MEASPPASKPILVMRDIHKSFKGHEVLKGLNIEVNRGKKMTFIGPSGSGKSTILRILMTLERPDSGKVLIDGESTWTEEVGGRSRPASEAHLRRMRRKIGMVFQHFNLFPHMSVLRNITEAPVHVLGVPKEEAEQRAIDLLEKVGLQDKAHAWPQKLSGGQKQRVAIARALAMEPEIMLFDEVTSALDPELVGEVVKVLLDLASESDMTMLLVTHQMNFAQAISDEVCFLWDGKILERGEPGRILQEPQEERTQQFLKTVLEFR